MSFQTIYSVNYALAVIRATKLLQLAKLNIEVVLITDKMLFEKNLYFFFLKEIQIF